MLGNIKWDIFSIVKSIVLIIAVLFVWQQWDKIMDRIESKPPLAPQVIKIEDNAWQIELAASKQQVEELKKQLEKTNSKILQIVKERNEKVDEVGIITAKLKQSVRLNQKSSHVYLKGKKTDHHFIKIYKKATDGQQFPIAWAMFHPNQTEEKLWKTGTYPIEFHAEIIETEEDSGKFTRYVEVNIENNQMKETKGNRYPIPITELKWAKNEKKTKRFSLWNPRLGFSGVFTDSFMAPTLDLSLSSYGRTDVDMDWRFVAFGLGAYNNTDDATEFVFTFSPAQWNFGTAVPLIKNAFIGPVIGWSEGTTSYGVGFSIPF